MSEASCFETSGSKTKSPGAKRPVPKCSGVKSLGAKHPGKNPAAKRPGPKRPVPECPGAKRNVRGEIWIMGQ